MLRGLITPVFPTSSKETDPRVGIPTMSVPHNQHMLLITRVSQRPGFGSRVSWVGWHWLATVCFSDQWSVCLCFDHLRPKPLWSLKVSRPTAAIQWSFRRWRTGDRCDSRAPKPPFTSARPSTMSQVSTDNQLISQRWDIQIPQCETTILCHVKTYLKL